MENANVDDAKIQLTNIFHMTKQIYFQCEKTNYQNKKQKEIFCSSFMLIFIFLMFKLLNLNKYQYNILYCDHILINTLLELFGQSPPTISEQMHLVLLYRVTSVYTISVVSVPIVSTAQLFDGLLMCANNLLSIKTNLNNEIVLQQYSKKKM
ncbi:hypothetical protein RFI_34621 [Reticulomyxa filosa]|uniref:Transmembrane protein n=1 Tax=Reticulomyxa filosa TaxID=46433 RepID=X6LPX1_RETFI|nr:hypothetical protein RFI_34621 [Reticulomyxa filosa]|eukprot:ETO02790.1 hypothetical protein RFI_34621 [Reticulomyxa filosa]